MMTSFVHGEKGEPMDAIAKAIKEIILAVETERGMSGIKSLGVDFQNDDGSFKSLLQILEEAAEKLTDEQAIEHLRSTGWMQNHDREMYDMGLKEQLADDSGSYDSLLPPAQPEIIRCKDCKHYYYADNRIPQEQRYVCDLDGDRWKADSFCSFAERRNDETD